MNGADLDSQITIIKELKELEFVNSQEFCQMAIRNVGCMTNYGQYNEYPLRIKALKEKVKESDFDEKAIEIAGLMYEDMILNFKHRIRDKETKYKKVVRREISRLRRQARAIKLIQQLLQLIVIIGATSVPFILNIPNSPREISTYLSGAVAISATLLNFYKFGEHIGHSYRAAEKLELEYKLFQTERGHYKALPSGAALDLFMDKMDELRQEQYEFSHSIEKAAQQENKDQIQSISKSKFIGDS